MADTALQIERDGDVAVFRLNRPDALNALNRPLRGELEDAFRSVTPARGPRVIILTGVGRAFCAGLDLKELGGETAEAATPGAPLPAADLISAVWECPVPVIGAINGFAITGGFELALACDLLIASRDARFADTHARVGVVPGWGLSQRLPRLIGIGRAKELSYTGNFLSAERAEAWGLVNRVVAPEALMPTCRALAEDMVSCEPETLCEIKRVIDTGYAETLSDGQRLEAQASRAWARGVRTADVAVRRRAMQARAREQD